MLVLSRRPGEKILLPDLSVSLEVMSLAGNTARIGVSAPRGVTIVRGELMTARQRAERERAAAEARHAQRNRLNKLQLQLLLAQRQRELGLTTEADSTLAAAFETLTDLVGTPLPLPKAQCRVRALVVDDDSNERELLAGLLAMHGCDCATASDGQDALNRLKESAPPDVVLLDMCMPRCDGATMLATVRTNPRWAGLKVFAISGSSPDELGIRTGPGGVDGWFAKPLNPILLWQAMQKELSQPSKN